jgi:hypothetical protein
MFERFYAEQALLKKQNEGIKSDPSNWEQRKNIARMIRRDRVKRWYLDQHAFLFRDCDFDVKAEDAALTAIALHELHRDFRRCAKTVNEKLLAMLMLSYTPDLDVFGDEIPFGRRRRDEAEDEEDEEGVEYDYDYGEEASDDEIDWNEANIWW